MVRSLHHRNLRFASLLGCLDNTTNGRVAQLLPRSIVEGEKHEVQDRGTVHMKILPGLEVDVSS